MIQRDYDSTSTEETQLIETQHLPTRIAQQYTQSRARAAANCQRVEEVRKRLGAARATRDAQIATRLTQHPPRWAIPTQTPREFIGWQPPLWFWITLGTILLFTLMILTWFFTIVH